MRAAWPVLDEEAAKDDEVELAVQVNGKVRGRIKVPPSLDEESVRARALEEAADQIAGKSVKKVVVVPGRLVSVVAK